MANQAGETKRIRRSFDSAVAVQLEQFGGDALGLSQFSSSQLAFNGSLWTGSLRNRFGWTWICDSARRESNRFVTNPGHLATDSVCDVVNLISDQPAHHLLMPLLTNNCINVRYCRYRQGLRLQKRTIDGLRCIMLQGFTDVAMVLALNVFANRKSKRKKAAHPVVKPVLFTLRIRRVQENVDQCLFLLALARILRIHAQLGVIVAFTKEFDEPLKLRLMITDVRPKTVRFCKIFNTDRPITSAENNGARVKYRKRQPASQQAGETASFPVDNR